MELWIVGRKHEDEDAFKWELMGVFSSEDKAIAACAEWYDFIAPMVLDVREPDETRVFLGLRWPVHERLMQEQA